jgi:hypothetical protein
MVSHPDVVGVRSQILGRGHDSKLDSPLIAESLVCPFPHRADLLDRGDTIIGNKHLLQL